MPAVSLVPIHDTFVDQDNPLSSYGSLGFLLVGNGNFVTSFNYGLTRIFLRYDLNSIPLNSIINSAQMDFRVFYDVSFYSAISYYLREVSDNTWLENTLTWNNQPASGSNIAIQDGPGTPSNMTFSGFQSSIQSALTKRLWSSRISAYDEATYGNYLNVTSSEYSTSDCPVLTIDYTPPSNFLIMF